ncbi:MAG TPA: multicopper oxidase domain-containing protein [Miltoncostaeaceae bacterium]|nr:multicopper oxidase domain-containing protein [Miltoncostaeaceae bacterium]
MSAGQSSNKGPSGNGGPGPSPNRGPGNAATGAAATGTLAPGLSLSGGHAGHGVSSAKISADPALAFCKIPHGAPATPRRVTADKNFTREFFGNLDLVMPDGKKLRFWGFRDANGPPVFPAPLIRASEGQIVHTLLHARKRVHTIHHHAIEPDTFNDGVGHVSFEVNPRYTYQWKATTAGTYFYHCHVNTTLHFQMGMFGPLVIDPPGGPGLAFTGGPTYDVEAIWALYAADPVYRKLSHAAGLCGGDVGLNLFNPQYFFINGAAHPTTRTSPEVAIQAKVGQTVLLRLIAASYGIHHITFGGLTGEVIAGDARPLPKSFMADSIEMVTAERYDVILRPTTPGVRTLVVEYRDWMTGALQGVAEGTLTVT